MATREATEHQGLENRLDGPLQGALHLLDRQLLDSEGKMLGKVDDIELTADDGKLVITSILTGPTALLSRLGPGLGDNLARKWVDLKVSEPNRSRPWRIDYGDIDRLDSALHLSIEREGALRRGRKGHRFGQLTGMNVYGPDDKQLGRVLDARFDPDDNGRQVLSSLVVGRRRPGSVLGYDRRLRGASGPRGSQRHQGPWLVRVVVLRLHRHTRLIDAAGIDIAWDEERVNVVDGSDH